MPAVTAPKASAPKKRRGRPRIGDCRVHVMVPEAVYQRLLERAEASGIDYTRLASQLLIKALLG